MNRPAHCEIWVGDTATGGPKVQESMASHAMETNALLRQESYFLDQFKV